MAFSVKKNQKRAGAVHTDAAEKFIPHALFVNAHIIEEAAAVLQQNIVGIRFIKRNLVAFDGNAPAKAIRPEKAVRKHAVHANLDRSLLRRRAVARHCNVKRLLPAGKKYRKKARQAEYADQNNPNMSFQPHNKLLCSLQEPSQFQVFIIIKYFFNNYNSILHFSDNFIDSHEQGLTKFKI